MLQGTGIAHYVLEDYVAAVVAFDACLKQDPDNLAAKMSLAMALEETGRLNDALEAWKSLPQESLSKQERLLIEAEIDELKKNLCLLTRICG